MTISPSAPVTEVANPTAAVLIIGDEILSGRTRDTNVHTIARFLAAIGVDLMEVRMVHDVEAQIIEALNLLRGGHDYVLTTGGIGPTHDDITAVSVARAFGVDISINPEALRRLEVRAREMNYELNDNSRLMARIPHGAELIDNPVSAAPGFHIGNVFVLAGVPKIMEAMLDSVRPRLRTGRKVSSRTVKLTDVGESWAADLLKGLDSDYPDLSFGSYPFGPSPEGRFGTHLVIRGKDEGRLQAALEALKTGLIPIVEAARARRPEARFDEIVSNE